jgi:hypothetical protein
MSAESMESFRQQFDQEKQQATQEFHLDNLQQQDIREWVSRQTESTFDPADIQGIYLRQLSEISDSADQNNWFDQQIDRLNIASGSYQNAVNSIQNPVFSLEQRSQALAELEKSLVIDNITNQIHKTREELLSTLGNFEANMQAAERVEEISSAKSALRNLKHAVEYQRRGEAMVMFNQQYATLVKGFKPEQIAKLDRYTRYLELEIAQDPDSISEVASQLPEGQALYGLMQNYSEKMLTDREKDAANKNTVLDIKYAQDLDATYREFIDSYNSPNQDQENIKTQIETIKSRIKSAEAAQRKQLIVSEIRQAYGRMQVSFALGNQQEGETNFIIANYLQDFYKLSENQPLQLEQLRQSQISLNSAEAFGGAAPPIRGAIQRQKERILSGSVADRGMKALGAFLSGTGENITAELLYFINDALSGSQDLEKDLRKEFKKLKNKEPDETQNQPLYWQKKMRKLNQDHDQPLLHAAAIELAQAAHERLAMVLGYGEFDEDGRFDADENSLQRKVFTNLVGDPQAIAIYDQQFMSSALNIENLGKAQIKPSGVIATGAIVWGTLVTGANLIPTFIRGFSGEGWDLENPYLYMGPLVSYGAARMLKERGLGLRASPHANFTHMLLANNHQKSPEILSLLENEQEMRLLQMIDWNQINGTKGRNPIERSRDQARDAAKKTNETADLSIAQKLYWDTESKPQLTPQMLEDYPLINESNRDDFKQALGLISSSPKANITRMRAFRLIHRWEFNRNDLEKLSYLLREFRVSQSRQIGHNY